MLNFINTKATNTKTNTSIWLKILKITISGVYELRQARDFLFGIILTEINDLPKKQYLLCETMMKTHQNYKKNFKFEKSTS